MKPLFAVVSVLFILVNSPASAQTYTQSDRIAIAQSARQLVEKVYLENLDILTHYEADQPTEALQNHIRALVRDAFRSRDVLVYNEFRNSATPTTIEEYVKDCRIFAGGKPVVNTLNVNDIHYELQQTKDGQPFINLYLDKQVQGSNKQGRPFKYRYLAEFRIMFAVDRQQKLYYNFRIAGINKAEKWPPTAFTLTDAELRYVENEQKDLSTALSSLVNQLKETLPTNAQRLTLEMFTYKRCGVNDALSDRIFATLSSCLEKQTSVTVVSPSQSTTGTLTLRGSYEQNLNNLQLVAELYDPLTNRVLNTLTNAELPLTWLSQQQLKLKPEHYEQIVAIRDSLQQKTVATPTALTISIRMDKGRTSVEYWQGNQAVVEAKANLPCHLRLVYLLADGRKCLLKNDFEIKPGQENQYIRLDSIECTAPFGMEYLLAYAAEDDFCPITRKPNSTLYVRNEDGYEIIVGSMVEVIKGATCTKRGNQVAEDRIQITTRGLK